MSGRAHWDETGRKSAPEDAARRELERAMESANDIGIYRCVERAEPIRSDGRFWFDRDGLVPYCAACSHREFRPVA